MNPFQFALLAAAYFVGLCAAIGLAVAVLVFWVMPWVRRRNERLLLEEQAFREARREIERWDPHSMLTDAQIKALVARRKQERNREFPRRSER